MQKSHLSNQAGPHPIDEGHGDEGERERKIQRASSEDVLIHRLKKMAQICI